MFNVYLDFLFRCHSIGQCLLIMMEPVVEVCPCGLVGCHGEKGLEIMGSGEVSLFGATPCGGGGGGLLVGGRGAVWPLGAQGGHAGLTSQDPALQEFVGHGVGDADGAVKSIEDSVGVKCPGYLQLFCGSDRLEPIFSPRVTGVKKGSEVGDPRGAGVKVTSAHEGLEAYGAPAVVPGGAQLGGGFAPLRDYGQEAQLCAGAVVDKFLSLRLLRPTEGVDTSHPLSCNSVGVQSWKRYRRSEGVEKGLGQE